MAVLGGKLSSSLNINTTHIITKLDYHKLEKHLKWNGWRDKPVHTLEWVTESLRRGRRVDDSEFVITSPLSTTLFTNNTSKSNTTTISRATPCANVQPYTSSSSYHFSASVGTVNITQSSSKRPYQKNSCFDNSLGDGNDLQVKRLKYSLANADSDVYSKTSDEYLLPQHTLSVSLKNFISRDSSTSFEKSWLSYDTDNTIDYSLCSSSLDTTVAMTPPTKLVTHTDVTHLPASYHTYNGHDGDEDSHDGEKKHDTPWDSFDDITNACGFLTPPLSPIGSGGDTPTKTGEDSSKKKAKVKGKSKIDKRSFFVCQNSPTNNQNQNNNKDITGIKDNMECRDGLTLKDILQRLEDTAESTGDKWRAFAYRKAITTLKRLPYKVTSYDQVKTVKGIGNRIAEKIKEIIDTGKLRKADIRDPMTDTLKLFSNVFGAGPETVKKWYAQGYRTLQDVQKAPSLNHQQTVGIKYYYEFLQRIPRDEVTALEAKVKTVALTLDSTIQLATCGSYRRGKADCGDIDILLSQLHPSPGFLKRLVDQLHEMGIITDHLTSSVVDKYMGVCHLSSHGLHRRIDLRLIPLLEWPCALLYFTGSDHFNRSMRLWARKHGYSLNEHALVQRWGRLNRHEVKGEPLAVTSEEDVFHILGLEYRLPKDRDV